jgi:hypothetical protein
MKAYRENKTSALKGVSGQLHTPAALPPGKKPGSHNGSFCGPHSRSGRYGEEKNISPCQMYYLSNYETLYFTGLRNRHCPPNYVSKLRILTLNNKSKFRRPYSSHPSKSLTLLLSDGRAGSA